MCWPPRITSYESGTCVSACVTKGSQVTMASTLPSFSAGARPNCDQMFSMVTSSYFTPARRSTILKYSSEVWPFARPIFLPRTSPILPTLMPLPFLVTIASGVSQRSLVASFMIRPMTWNGLPACTAFR